MPKKTNTKKVAKKTQKVEAKRVKKRGRGGALKRDLIEKAFGLYCEKIAIREIARKLSISTVTLHKYKKAEKWEERKNSRLAKAADKADDEYAKTRARQIGLSQALQSKGLERLKELGKQADGTIGDKLTVKETRLFITDGVRLERELLGQVNTDIKIVVLFPPELMDI